jgi:hypothetical protein
MEPFAFVSVTGSSVTEFMVSMAPFAFVSVTGSSVTEFMVSMAPFAFVFVQEAALRQDTQCYDRIISLAHDLQRPPKRKETTREACYWPHAWQRFNPSKGGKSNSIGELHNRV